MIDIEKKLDLYVTPSQYLFSYWKDLCGSTNVLSGVELVVNNDVTLDFEAAYERFKANRPELNATVNNSGDSYAKVTYQLTPNQSKSFEFHQLPAVSNIEQAREDLLNLELGLEPESGHKLSVYQVGKQQYFVFLVVEHLFADGLGVDALLQDYLLNLQNKAEQQNIMDRALSYIEQLKEYDTVQEGGASETENSEFVSHYMKDVLTKRFLWEPVKTLDTHIKGRFKTQQLRLTKDEKETVERISSSCGVSLFSTLLYCFSRAFFEHNQGLQGAVLQIPTHGKKLNEKVFSDDLVGCFAQSFLVSLERQAICCDLTETAKSLNSLQNYSEQCLANQVDQVLAVKTANSLKSSKLKSMLADGEFATRVRKAMPSNVYFSYYGNSKVASDYPDFNINQYFLSTTNLSGALDVMLVSHGEQIELSFNYDSEHISLEVVTGLIAKLKQVIALLASSELGGKVTQASAEHANLDIYSDDKELTLNALLNCLNQYALEPVSPNDLDFHLEIDLGIDSLRRTRILAEFETETRIKVSVEQRPKFYSAMTVQDLFTAVASA